VKVFVVGARGGMCRRLQWMRAWNGPGVPGARVSAFWVSAAAPLAGCALLSTSACTLTSDSFDPAMVDRARAATTSVGAGGGVPPEGSTNVGGASSEPAATSGLDESGTDPVRLEPAEPDEGELGRARGAGVEPVDEALPGADAGAASDDAAPDETAPEPDAGGPVVLAATCSTETFGTSCYEVFGTPLAWVDAEARCVAWGGHLASVESPPEDAFLEVWRDVLGLPPGNGSGVWLGGTDAAQEGIFLWADGSPVLLNGWAFGQPNDGAGVDCIEKRNDGTDLWYDQRCTDARPFICERPL
jgi:lectin-like protein